MDQLRRSLLGPPRTGLRHSRLLHAGLRRLHRQPKNPLAQTTLSRTFLRSASASPTLSQRLSSRIHHSRPHPPSRRYQQHRPRRRRLRLRRRHHRRRPRPRLPPGRALASALHANNLAAYQHAHRRIQRLPTVMSRALLLMDRHPRLRDNTIGLFEHHPSLFATSSRSTSATLPCCSHRTPPPPPTQLHPLTPHPRSAFTSPLPSL